MSPTHCARGHAVEVWYLYRRTDQPLPQGPCRLLVDRDVSRSLGYAVLPWLLFAALRRFRPDTVISFSPLAHVLGQTAAMMCGVPRSGGGTQGRALWRVPHGTVPFVGCDRSRSSVGSSMILPRPDAISASRRRSVSSRSQGRAPAI